MGLGNPGPQYAPTRHNVGFWLLEKLCEQYRGSLNLEPKFKGITGCATIDGHVCRLLLPTTYMNKSGEAVSYIANFYKILPKQILVVHDDLDLPTGSARLKFDGGHGGHNGLRDIISAFNSNEFFRLRLGIGHPGERELVHDYVLHKPNLDDKQKIQDAIDASLAVIPDVIRGNIEKAMTKLHTLAK